MIRFRSALTGWGSARVVAMVQVPGGTTKQKAEALLPAVSNR